MLGGCGVLDRGFLSPAGPVAQVIHDEFLLVCLVMLFVIVPVLLLVPLVAWHYRLSNTKSAYRPQWRFNWSLEGLIWIPPTAIVIFLAVFLWRDTHRLDPYKPLPGEAVTVQAIAADWKWIFVYPEQGVASVNRLVIPAGRPVHLDLTSATVMQAILMPRLAGQIAVMAGMRTQLNIQADAPGSFFGENTQFNGFGFQNEKFAVDAMDAAGFGIATMTIGIPTGVKIYDWIWTMFRGEVRFTPPMVLSMAFMMTFVLGGFTGIILATPPLDYMMHNTLFLVAHFHNMLIPGTLYGLLAGYMYWFPKAFGFRLNERWGWFSASCWILGFYLAFFPLYVLGASGMARRTQEVFDPAFRPWLLVALFGAFILLTALTTLFVQLYVSIRDRHANAVPVGDPWDARGLEWSVAAPPPEWNFATIPHVGDRDAFYWRKRAGGAYRPADHYLDIEMPRNTACGLVIGIAAGMCCFGLVWRIWWMTLLFAGLVVATVIVRSFMRNVTKTIPAAAVEAADRSWLAQAQAAQPIPREQEQSGLNQGRARIFAQPTAKHA